MIIISENRKIYIRKSHIPELKRELEWWYGVTLTKREILSILRKNHSLAMEVATEVDTVTREETIDEISLDLVNKCWPKNCNRKKYKEVFFKQFRRAFQRKYRKWNGDVD